MRKLLVVTRTRRYCQPCVSPVWDTGAGRACADRGRRRGGATRRRRGARLARSRAGARRGGRLGCGRPGVRPGGWAFQYANPHYPDVDDTAVVAMAMDRTGLDATVDHRRRSRARANGSSACRARTAAGARSTPTTRIYYLNHIPFADHGALLDPPTADVTARCVSMLAQLGRRGEQPAAGARRRLSAARAGGGRQLVRPLGHQLHLRHLVGAGALNAAGVDRSRAGDPPGGGLAGRDAARRRRLGRGRRELQARRQGLRARAEHGLADRLGVVGADGGRRGRRIRRWRAASPI